MKEIHDDWLKLAERSTQAACDSRKRWTGLIRCGWTICALFIVCGIGIAVNVHPLGILITLGAIPMSYFTLKCYGDRTQWQKTFLQSRQECLDHAKECENL